MDESNSYNRMDMNIINQNAAVLEAELQWLALIIDTRMKLYWGQPCDYADINDVPVNTLADSDTRYAKMIKEYDFSINERVVLLLALAPHVQPHLLDVFFIKNANYDRGFTEFGGIKGQNHSGFIPTGETAAFILAANHFENRFLLFDIFGEDHFFRKLNLLKLVAGSQDEPMLSGTIQITAEYLNYFTTGVSHKPDFNVNFPAKRITTDLRWEDLILEDSILENIYEIKDWITYGDTLLNEWGMRKQIKPGYRSLFYGPPGTGKTLTASLLGKENGLDVYRIDLSMVVSKFIGETEKILPTFFSRLKIKTGFYFLMKQMHYLVSERKPAVPMTDMPIRKYLISCSG